MPQLQNFQQKLEEANAVDVQTNVQLDELRRLQELAEIQPAIESQLTYLDASVPSDLRISSYVDILDELAARNDITISLLRIGGASPYVPQEPVAAEEKVVALVEANGGRLLATPIDLSVNGTYANLVSFMNELQKSPRTTVIQSGNLSFSGGQQTSLSLQTLIFSIAPGETQTE